jgi:hypothetical protein
MNFNPYFPHLLPDLGEILYRSALDAAKQCNTKTQEGGVDQSAVTKVRARRKEFYFRWSNNFYTANPVQTSSAAHFSSYWICALAASLEVKRLVREADHPPVSSVETKSVWNYSSTVP